MQQPTAFDASATGRDVRGGAAPARRRHGPCPASDAPRSPPCAARRLRRGRGGRPDGVSTRGAPGTRVAPAPLPIDVAAGQRCPAVTAGRRGRERAGRHRSGVTSGRVGAETANVHQRTPVGRRLRPPTSALVRTGVGGDARLPFPLPWPTCERPRIDARRGPARRRDPRVRRHIRGARAMPTIAQPRAMRPIARPRANAPDLATARNAPVARRGGGCLYALTSRWRRNSASMNASRSPSSTASTLPVS